MNLPHAIIRDSEGGMPVSEWLLAYMLTYGWAALWSRSTNA